METTMKTQQNPTRAWALMAAGILLTAGLTACSTTGGTADAGKETIAYSLGPCYGFCPVYALEVTPSGHVTFVGERHTAVVGKMEREAGPAAYNTVASALKAYRPAEGTTARTQCDQQATDHSTYGITWTKPDGTRTVLGHDLGCFSPRNTALNKVLQAIPAELGVTDWTQQKTEPGAER